MQEISSENCTLICQPLQSLQEFEVDNTKKYAQLILNFFWVVYDNDRKENTLIYAHHNLFLTKILRIFSVSVNPIIIQNRIKKNNA